MNKADYIPKSILEAGRKFDTVPYFTNVIGELVDRAALNGYRDKDSIDLPPISYDHPAYSVLAMAENLGAIGATISKSGFESIDRVLKCSLEMVPESRLEGFSISHRIGNK